jgi:hypothetical protein
MRRLWVTHKGETLRSVTVCDGCQERPTLRCHPDCQEWAVCELSVEVQYLQDREGPAVSV